MHATGQMSGKRVLVTGANAGIGFAIAQALAAGGAEVLVHGRDAAKVETAVHALRRAGKGVVTGFIADFTSLADIAHLADEVGATGPLDVLVNNAGLMRDRRDSTADGFDVVFQVNHLAAFVLTMRLLPALRAAPAGRVVTVASGAHGMVKDLALDGLAQPATYRPMHVYARSKACNILFTQEFARRVGDDGPRALCFHPGLVASRFARDGDVTGPLRLLIPLFRPFSKTPEQGARTGVWLASATPAPEPNGGYFIAERVAAPEPYARDGATAAALWSLSERLAGPHLSETPDARAG